MNYNKISDNELISYISISDQLAFNEIYNRYWEILFRHAMKMLVDHELAADIIQDVFTSLWQKKEEIFISTNLSSYLYTATRNRVITHINKSKLKDSHLQSLTEFANQGIETTDEWLNEKELATIIEKEIDLLPPKMRRIFEMSRNQHLSYNEIAQELNITQHTVKKQISNVLKILKAKFKIIILFF